MEFSLFKDNNAFVAYDIHHWFALAFFLVFGCVLIYFSNTRATTQQQDLIGKIYACFLSLVIIAWTITKYVLNDFDIRSDLPLHLCNIIALSLPLYAFTRKKLIFEILLFWVFSGTIQALITPDLKNGFPHYTYFKYWFAHAGVIVFMLYAIVVYKERPTLSSVFKSFAALQVYVVFIYIVNSILRSNYFFINRKPDVPTLLDLLGEWPYYILIGELIVIPFFLIIYLPFHLARKRIDQA